MLSGRSRVLLWIGVAAMLAFGLVSLLLPAWAAERFPWRVGPFLAQTIGGWSIGAAVYGALAARDGRFRVVYPLLIHLAVFGVAELMVAVAFLDRLVLGSVLTWPYLLGLVAVAAGSLVAWVDWRNGGGAAAGATAGPEAPRWMRGLALAFAAFVGVLTVATFLSGPDGAVARGRFFPEPMGLFSIRAFSAFFLAITVSALTPIRERHLWPLLLLLFAGMLLVVLITLATLPNLGAFDFTSRPGGLLYLGVYVGSAVLFLGVLWRYRADLPLRGRAGA